ncbi:MAG TPA: amino acid racemase [Candidatus Nanoarchaeia archaeon]|nr:amino acid racemase [Candidatus Nanoarchaeia archaeon]
MAKHIGIVGVTSEGASLCYRTICSEASKIMGLNHHPEISIHNHSFNEILEAQNKRDFPVVAKIIADSIKKLYSSGADFIIIPSNSVHFAFNEIEKNSPIPVLSIVEIAAKECKGKNYRKVGILGVGMTMSDGLFNEELKKYNITPVNPNQHGQKIVNDVIYQEIVPSKTTVNTIQKIIEVINSLKKQGCDAVILGCTELPLVINRKNSPLPFIDTTRLLAKKALEYALEK